MKTNTHAYFYLYTLLNNEVSLTAPLYVVHTKKLAIHWILIFFHYVILKPKRCKKKLHSFNVICYVWSCILHHQMECALVLFSCIMLIFLMLFFKHFRSLTFHLSLYFVCYYCLILMLNVHMLIIRKLRNLC